MACFRSHPFFVVLWRNLQKKRFNEIMQLMHNFVCIVGSLCCRAVHAFHWNFWFIACKEKNLQYFMLLFFNISSSHKFILLWISYGNWRLYSLGTFFSSIFHATEEPKPTMNCPRLNGYFAHKGTCDKFYYCVDGMFNMIVCPAGLVFNPRTGMIQYINFIIQKRKISSEKKFCVNKFRVF